MSAVTAPARHLPVLRDRVAALLSDAPDGVVVDCTIGAGGHAAAIATARRDRYGQARIIGIDRDPHALALAADALAPLDAVDAELVRARFDALDQILDDRGLATVAGILFDLGISSMHVDDAERGFSYRNDGPLDMRMDPSSSLTAADVVNSYEQLALARVLRNYGEERFAARIAGRIVASRPFHSTTQLAAVVRDAIPAATRRTGPHPATRTFQALRIEVNGELDAFASALPQAIARLAPQGVCVVLAYHSLEDRIAKRTFADAAVGCICPPDLPVCACGRVPTVDLLTSRPERPSAEEVESNKRASAARLRAIRKRAVT